MALTAEQHAKREGMVTASFLPYLMAGDKAKILSEWQRIVGDTAYAPENLDDVWPVQFGSWIEPFALDWHERKTKQPLTMRGDWVVRPERPYFGCTLDAYRTSDSCVIDCKAPGMWRKIEDVTAQYTAQMVGQAWCMATTRAALLIVHGGSEPVEYPIEWTPEYEAEVWARVDQFWGFCESLTPPVELPAIAAPVPVIRIAQMDDNPEWKRHADLWLQTHGAVETAKTAEKAIKAMVEPDVMKALGAGIVVTRNKAGSLSLREDKK